MGNIPPKNIWPSWHSHLPFHTWRLETPFQQLLCPTRSRFNTIFLLSRSSFSLPFLDLPTEWRVALGWRKSQHSHWRKWRCLRTIRFPFCEWITEKTPQTNGTLNASRFPLRQFGLGYIPC